MFIEHVEGFAKQSLPNLVLRPPDSFMIFFNSGVNEVNVAMALEGKSFDLPVIAVVSVDHCTASATKHSSGKRLLNVADATIDNATPAGDAMVRVDGLEDPSARART